MDLVLIEWVDAHSSDEGWTELEDLHRGPMHCGSVGWLVGKKDGMTTIVSNLAGIKGSLPRPQGSAAMTIPTAWIKKLTVLRRHKK